MLSYTRGVTSKDVQNRETFWAALEASTYLSRRFRLGQETRVRHSIEPSVIYEFVPPTDQSKLVNIDAIDDLQKKSLVTYSLKTRGQRTKPFARSQYLDRFVGCAKLSCWDSPVPG